MSDGTDGPQASSSSSTDSLSPVLLAFLLQLQQNAGANSSASTDGTGTSSSGTATSSTGSTVGSSNMPPPPMDAAKKLADDLASLIESLAETSKSTISGTGNSSTSDSGATASTADGTSSTGASAGTTDSRQAFEKAFAQELMAAPQAYGPATAGSSTQATATT